MLCSVIRVGISHQLVKRSLAVLAFVFITSLLLVQTFAASAQQQVPSPERLVPIPTVIPLGPNPNYSKLALNNDLNTDPLNITEALSPSSTPSSTPTIQDDTFTTQATLSLAKATQTNNIVGTKSYYDIMFRTSTSGIIKTIEFNFPPGTYVGTALLVEAVGIGPGKIAASGTTATGQKITYTVDNAVNIPAGTNIRIQISNIVNPQDPASNYVITVTTRDAASTTIDGPTLSRHYLIKQRE